MMRDSSFVVPSRLMLPLALSLVDRIKALLFSVLFFGTYLHPPWQGLPQVKASGITAYQATGLLSGTTGEFYLDYTERSGKILCHHRFTTEIPMLLFQHLHPTRSSAKKEKKRKERKGKEYPQLEYAYRSEHGHFRAISDKLSSPFIVFLFHFISFLSFFFFLFSKHSSSHLMLKLSKNTI